MALSHAVEKKTESQVIVFSKKELKVSFTWQVCAHVILFEGVLAGSSRTVSIRFILYDFHATVCPLTLFSTFFLQWKRVKDECQQGQCHWTTLTAIMYSWAILYSSTDNGRGILYSLISIVALKMAEMISSSAKKCKERRRSTASTWLSLLGWSSNDGYQVGW